MKRKTIAIVAVVLVAATAWAVSDDYFTDDPSAAIKGVPVRRGPLDITVLETGNLKAAKSVSLRSEIEGRSTILFLIDEGVTVTPGTLLCELDTTQLVNDRLVQEISVRNSESEKVKADASLQIQRSQNESDIKAADRQLEFAMTDLEKYREGDWPQALKQAGDDILLAEEELKRAQDKLSWSQRLFDDGFLTRTELEADELAAQRTKIRLEQSVRAKELLQQYDNPRQIRSLEADVEETTRELERVKLQAAARLVDYETDLDSRTRKLELEREKLAKMETQLTKSKIIAPIAGMVVYAKQNANRWSGGEPIAEGQEVRERQELITIPSADGMIVEASVHESVLEQVIVGQPVRITIDALPEREFRGRVRFKAVLPDQNSWWANPDLRVYRTEVEILDTDPGMRPGMTCAVRVEVAKLANCLHIPVQARFFQGEQAVVFVRNGDTIDLRPVELGLYNESWIEIRSGVEEGEIVLMSAPQGYQLADAPPPAGNAADVEEGAPNGGMPMGGFPGAGAVVPGGATDGVRPGASDGERGGGGGGGSGSGGRPEGRTGREGGRPRDTGAGGQAGGASDSGAGASTPGASGSAAPATQGASASGANDSNTGATAPSAPSASEPAGERAEAPGR